jgi:hypothetical protein
VDIAKETEEDDIEDDASDNHSFASVDDLEGIFCSKGLIYYSGLTLIKTKAKLI